MARPADVKPSELKKGTFATHAHAGAGALCHTVKRHGRLSFAEPPTCRRCRFYRLAPTLGREGALARMAEEDAAAAAGTTAPSH